MTIQTTANKAFGLGNGLTTNFNFNFLVPLASQMSVLLTDTTVTPSTTVTLDPATYNITGLGNPLGGTVTYPLIGPALVNGQNLTMIRTLPLSQLSSIRNQNGWYPGTVEDALDYLTMITQQLQEVMQRAFALATTDISGASTVLATPVPGGVIAWDVTGLKLINVALAAAGAAVFPLNTGMAVYTGSNVFGNCVTLTAGAGLQINNGNGIAGNPTFLIPANAITASMIPANIVIALGVGSTAPTPAVADNSTKIATTAFVGLACALPYYIGGLQIVNNGLTNMDIQVGACADGNNSHILSNAATFTKSQAAFAAGTGNGGKMSAAAMANNTWYYWYALRKDSDGTIEFGFDVSPTAPTAQAGYTAANYRYIGARKTQVASTSWDSFVQHGDDVLWNPAAFAFDANNSAATTANRTLLRVNTPAVKCEFRGHMMVNPGVAATVHILLTDPSCADIAAGAANTPLSSLGFSMAGSFQLETQVRCWTDASGQIGVRAAAATNFTIITMGWRDLRGAPV